MQFRKVGTPNTLTQIENNAQKTRAITGDGTAFLKVPGLTLLLGVAVATASGRLEMPLKEERLVMVHPDDDQPRERVTEQLFHLEREEYDTSILFRSELSNSGLWQKDTTFYITGEWEDPSTTSTDAPPTGTSSIDPPTLPSAENTGSTTGEPDLSKQEDADSNSGNGEGAPSSFASLPEELQAKLAQLGSIEKILAATNDDLKAVGIAGNDITRVKNAIRSLTPPAG